MSALSLRYRTRYLVFLFMVFAVAFGALGDLPLRPGDVVATCMAGLNTPGQPSNGFMPNSPVVGVIDASTPGAQPPAQNWLAPMFHNDASADAWTASNLGQVFGIALEEGSSPDIYVTAGSVYFLAVDPSKAGDSQLAAEEKLLPHMYGPLGPGGVYRLRSADGAICYHARLPNSGPGLGNIAYDREHDQLFVSNFEDGLVYRLPAGGACIRNPNLIQTSAPGASVQTYDHGQSRVNATHAVLSPLDDDGVELEVGPNFPPPDKCAKFAQSGFTPLGRRVWAVQVHEGRLFYSVWNEDKGKDRHDPSGHNEIWSVEILPGGSLASQPRLEVSVSDFRTNDWSSPVSDLAFSKDGQMLAAERVRCRDFGVGNGRELHFNAHQARVLEYEPLHGGGWLETRQLPVGRFGNANSAGGVDYGYGYVGGSGNVEVDDEACGLTYWMTGDFYKSFGNDLIYGLQGSPKDGTQSNALLNSSYVIDLDGEVTDLDKASIGDVEAFRDSCLPQPCLDERTVGVRCLVDDAGLASGEYSWTFRIFNHSGGVIQHVFFIDLPSGVTVSPEHLVLDRPLEDGRVSREFTVTISGDPPPGPLGLRMTVHDAELVQCCAQSLAVEIPDCSCGQLLSRQTPFCEPLDVSLASLVRRFSFNFQNLSGIPIEYLFVTPVDPTDRTTPLGPDVVTVTNPGFLGGPVQSGASTGSLSVEIGGPGAASGQEVCLRLSSHDRLFRECCSRVECMTVPRCGPSTRLQMIESCPAPVN